MSTAILGISAFYHDSAAALIVDGRIAGAVQEERFTRKKHDNAFPNRAVRAVLGQAGLAPADLDCVVYYEKPWLKFGRILESFAAAAPSGLPFFLRSMRSQLGGKMAIRSAVRRHIGFKGPVRFSGHHTSHAASCFYPSPFDQAAFLTVDGVGEWETTTFGAGRGDHLEIAASLHFPHSMGLLYAAFTAFLGFKVNSGEYKVMGLAPYGEPRYTRQIMENMLDLKEDGSFCLNMDYFDYLARPRMFSDRFAALFGRPPRAPESPLTQDDMDLARSIQEVSNEAVLRMARHVRKETGLPDLCLAGGVALNCVANGKMLKEGIFDRIWIQPAAGDAGGALGAALHHWHHVLGNPRRADGHRDSQSGSYLGTVHTREDIQDTLDCLGAAYTRMDDPAEQTADLLAQGAIVGWFAGRMEFGPRALGGRSILGDPRSPAMQKDMNLKIKYRESFRPFAPSVLAEHAPDWFDIHCESPYMLLITDVQADKCLPPEEMDTGRFGLDKLNACRSQIPAVTHVDYSARLQTVNKQDNPAYYRLIKAFHKKTGCPVIINTSFNVRGEPIVCTPEDAYRCFMRTNMDYLVLEDFLLAKTDQPTFEESDDWKEEFTLD